MKISHIFAESGHLKGDKEKTLQSFQDQLATAKRELEDLPQNPPSQAGYDALDDAREKVKRLQHRISQMSEATVNEDAFDRAQQRKMALANLYNKRAALREQIKQAREEQDRERVSELESRLSRLGDSIDELENVTEAAGARVAAAEQYVNTYGECEHLITVVQDRLSAHATRAEKDPRNWGYVGDLDHVAGELKKLVEFLH